MAGKTKSMSQIKQLLLLKKQGLSNRKAAGMAGKLKEDSYKLVLNKLSDNYPTTEKYCPNNVIYNVDALLEYDKCVGGVGYRYRVFVEDALKEVIRDPFVTSISHIIVSDDKRYTHIKVWTKIHQDGSFKKMRLYEFDVIDGLLVKTT